MKMYWWRLSFSRNNFGDELGPYLLREVTGREPEFAPIAASEIVTVGSVIHYVPSHWPGIVLGTGSPAPDADVGTFARARVLAVRGALTRDLCGLPERTPLGDPGILVGLLAEAAPSVDVGIVPNYVDHELAGRHPDALLIDVREPVADVIAAIARCRLVHVSSLHALVVADALGIPQVWEPSPAVLGGAWKFDDYASAFDERIAPYELHLTDRAAMAHRQAEMAALWRSLA